MAVFCILTRLMSSNINCMQIMKELIEMKKNEKKTDEKNVKKQ